MKYRVEEYDTSTIVKETDSLEDAIFHANFFAGTTETGVYDVIENLTNKVEYRAGDDFEIEGMGNRFYKYICDNYTPDDFEEKKARLYA